MQALRTRLQYFSSHASAAASTASPETVVEVQNWLHTHGFSQYSRQFLLNEIDGSILPTLTSEELRDDLQVVNLRHRRDLLNEIAKLPSASAPKLPEHGRILDHLSNVRTYHSWIRVGVQLLAFSVVTLRLAPTFRSMNFVAACAFYFASVGVLALTYAVFRYKSVITMIEKAGHGSKYTPDTWGVGIVIALVLIASILVLALIGIGNRQ